MRHFHFNIHWLKVTLVALAVTAVAGMACAAGCRDTRGGDESPDGCLVVRPEARVDTVRVPAAKMGRDITNVVVVPASYSQCGDSTRYPVVYLLHGFDGTCFDWPRKADLRRLCDRYGIIVVCPDGQDSWYFDSPVDPKMQFETYVSVELPAWVDAHYRTRPDAAHRAVTGLSMGGHGALWLAFRHPEVFGACASMSGGVDITKFPGKWRIAERLGPYESNRKRWADHSVISLVPRLKPGQAILIDDGYDDIFYRVNLSLHDALLKQGIQHEFTVRPGRHSWDYWVNALDYHLMYFDKFFGRARRAPLPKPHAAAPAKVHAQPQKQPRP